ncbi:chalcone isomerase family protein [Sansalvadorimonas sp. 2012CJ34-2]|uniref:Chalcone isomerase family protein n=1 Tax=Parendozoicomonas callyspongiae TaxID=2942213 RepID=A0ABT0PG74_9GAMM|nr:chalcone isomerase family protein [Sansalvadorimonas sp. 2012CJ34-2]MCL6270378.1 chalcone isomerase family protein [Sansalvadorimonas sp. 2012CJ34-2]
MKRFTAFVLACMLSLSAQAKEVEGVPLQDSLTIHGSKLQLNGAGVRSKFFIDLYVGSLYTVAAETDGENILSGKQPAAVRLNIISGLITSDKMVSTVQEGFETVTGGNVGPLQDRINDFLNVFNSEEIKKGDQFTLVSKPGVGVTAFKNDKEVALVNGDDFRKALFGIWLGNKPADKGLKKAMLGN